jgi:hypothetical protein
MRWIKRSSRGFIINTNQNMAQRRAFIFLVLLIGLCLASIDAHSQQIRAGKLVVLERDSATTSLIRTIKVAVDTGNQAVRDYIKRLADSVAALRSGVDYLPYYMYGVLPNNTSDSVNLQVGVNGVYEAILPNFAMKAFNFALLSTNGTGLISTWRTDLPSLIGNDSTFIVRVSRNDAMNPKCAATVYKMPITAGADINDKTVGTFYDMVRFSDTILPAGANRFFTFNMMMRRQ